MSASPIPPSGPDLADASPDALVRRLAPDTDLPRLVVRAVERGLHRLVVAGEAVAAWHTRDPAGWRTVSVWLAARGVEVVVAPHRP